MADPLDPRALVALIPALLPTTTSSPLPHPADSLAALVHAVHVALGFRHNPPTPSTGTGTTTGAADAGPSASADIDIDDTASETTTAVDADESGAGAPAPAHVDPGNILAADWNARGEDAYSFSYTHPQSAMAFRVRVGRMGARVQVDAMADDGTPYTVSTLVADVLDTAAFPIPSAATGTRTEASRDPAQALGFRNVDSVRNLVDNYNRDVIARLIPGLNKEGYRAPPVSAAPPAGGGAREPPNAGPGTLPNPGGTGGPARPNPLIDPLHPAAAPAGLGRQPAASIGHRDLDPFGGANPLDPLGRPNPAGAGGGMYADFNHPLFDGRGGRGLDTGPGGLINPPGARWDPVGPGAEGGAAGPRFPSAGGNPLGGVGITDPEWGSRRFGDEMAPPGEDGPQPQFGQFQIDPAMVHGRGGRPGAGGPGGGLPHIDRMGRGGGGLGGGGGPFGLGGGGGGGFGGGGII